MQEASLPLSALFQFTLLRSSLDQQDTFFQYSAPQTWPGPSHWWHAVVT